MKIALPSELDQAEFRRMNQALQSSLQYLSDEINGDKRPILYSENFFPTWRSHGYYHACIRAIIDGQLEKARQYLRLSIDNVFINKIKPSPRYLLPSNGARDMQILRGELALHTDRAIGAGYVTHEVAGNNTELEKVSEAIELLAASAPSFHIEYSNLVDDILLIGEDDGVHIRSASSFNLFGLIIIWADSIHTPIYYLQQIVHEVAHLRLFIVNIEDQLVLNPPEERFKAPFRDDERPMLGIFHAMFVLARMVLALRKTRSYLPNHSLYPDLEDKLIRSEERFYNTVKEVEEHGVLTDIGRSILGDCLAAISQTDTERLRRAS